MGRENRPAVVLTTGYVHYRLGCTNALLRTSWEVLSSSYLVDSTAAVRGWRRSAEPSGWISIFNLVFGSMTHTCVRCVRLCACSLARFARNTLFLQELVVEELVRMTDALSREANLQIIQALKTLTEAPLSPARITRALAEAPMNPLLAPLQLPIK